MSKTQHNHADILKDNIAVKAYCSFETLYFSNDGILKDYLNNQNFFNVKFYHETLDETDEDIEIARMKFRICKYYDLDNMCEIADEIGQDNLSSVETAYKYICQIDKLCESDDFDEIIEFGDYTENDILYNICCLQEFYINPKYRGKQLSTYFLYMIPSILNHFLYITEGVITTHINPYKEQNDINRLNENANEYNDKNTKMKTIMEKPLLETGFTKIGDKDDYAISIHELRQKRNTEGIPYLFLGEYR